MVPTAQGETLQNPFANSLVSMKGPDESKIVKLALPPLLKPDQIPFSASVSSNRAQFWISPGARRKACTAARLSTWNTEADRNFCCRSEMKFPQGLSGRSGLKTKPNWKPASSRIAKSPDKPCGWSVSWTRRQRNSAANQCLCLTCWKKPNLSLVITCLQVGRKFLRHFDPPTNTSGKFWTTRDHGIYSQEKLCVTFLVRQNFAEIASKLYCGKAWVQVITLLFGPLIPFLFNFRLHLLPLLYTRHRRSVPSNSPSIQRQGHFSKPWRKNIYINFVALFLEGNCKTPIAKWTLCSGDLRSPEQCCCCLVVFLWLFEWLK